MASEVAQPQPELLANSLSTTNGTDAPLTNGDHEHAAPATAPATAADESRNADAFEENAAVSKSNLDGTSVAPADPNPAGPTPIEDVAPGITPVANFIPKEAPASHPTPPPDEPLLTSEANVDIEMTPADEPPTIDTPAQSQPDPQTDSTSAPIAAPASEPVLEPAIVPEAPRESSLVRPREEDDDGEEEDERAAKRSRMEDTVGADATSTDAAPAAQPEAAIPTTEAPQSTETDNDVSMDQAQATEAQPEAAKSEVSAAPVATTSEIKATDADSKPAESTNVPQPRPQAAQPTTAPASSYSTKPLTQAQTKFLAEKMKNLKKTKHAVPFLVPVDPVALNIPSYPEIIKNPMDLGTMEQKLKSGTYVSVQEFADDFNLILHNTRTFNGPNHAVTQSGLSMEAYFRKMMEGVPSADAPLPQKTQAKKASPKPPQPSRRESRSLAQPAPAPAPAPAPTTASNSAAEPFALGPNGTPQIRRDSTINRPARTIKPPPARELAYAKPKRKEHQLELKFCEETLEKIRSPRYGTINHVFQAPVDPVALNIPNYRQIIKHPMDLGTMAQKLKQGQYGKASEFKKDFDLMISNCILFNPPGNPVRDLGIQLQREFEAMWRGKDSWEKKRKSEAQRAASASADEESVDDEEEEEEEDVAGDDPAGTIRALQKQLADMQNALAGLGKQPTQQKKKAKPSKTSTKKAGGASASAPKSKPAPAPKSKPKKVKAVTYEEKQEISDAVSRMDGNQVEGLTNIITKNCSKYANQEEMELEIDDLPNNVQAMLLSYVRSIFGGPKKERARQPSPDDLAAADDDDFEPERRGSKGGSKRKKHKPMGKAEQQSAISNIQKQLAQFQGTAGGSASPTNSSFAAKQEDDSSDDDESEESEEE